MSKLPIMIGAGFACAMHATTLRTILVCAAICLTGTSYQQGQALAAANPAGNNDEQIIRAQAREFEDAFNAGNAAEISGMWVSDGSLIDEDGEKLCGQSEIQKHYEALFKKSGTDKLKAQKLKVRIRSLSFPSDNLAVEEGTTELGNKSFSYYSALHTKRGGKWQMLNVVEFPGSGLSVSPLKDTSDLSWLFGNWTATRNDSETKEHLKIEPLGKNFLSCRFLSDNGNLDSLEIIGLNENHQIASWTFNANGGYGIARWQRRGDDWNILSKSYETNGAIGRALYFLHKNGNDKFTWQSQGRMIDQLRLPDTAVIEVVRDANK